jgi:NADPH-dependent curcumin reductase CurA
VQAGQRIVLASRPAGDAKASDFRLEEFAPPAPELGEVFLQTKWLSLDPYMRGRMIDGPSYAKPVALGAVMIGGTVSEVVTSKADGFTPGDIVLGQTGWQTHAVAKGDALRRLDASVAPVTTALGILGMPGLTAYSGLTEIGKPKRGETVVVAAASGAVGSVVGQIVQDSWSARSASSVERASVSTSPTSLGSTTASTAAPEISSTSLSPPALTASMSASRTPVGRSLRVFFHCSTHSPASRFAA